jgi:hypothetical protein
MEESRLRISEIRLLRSICGRKRNEVRGERRILGNEELNYLYSLPNTVRVIKSKRMRLVGLAARMWESGGVYMVFVEKPEERNPLEDPGIDGRIILRLIFRKWDVRAWIESIQLRIGTGVRHL